MRINRYLALAGVTSRRRADDLVREGRVRINGEISREVGVGIDPDTDEITVDGIQVGIPEPIVLLLNKPSGYLVSRRSQGGKPTIYSLLPGESRKVEPVGRLDYDTDGVLLLTNDGELSRRLQHPRFRIERVYHAVVAAAPDPEKINLIRRGVNLGDKRPMRAMITPLPRAQNQHRVEVRLREGRKHEVKRLLEWAEAPVVHLTRVQFAGLTVGNLKPGESRKLARPEYSGLRDAVKLGEISG